MSEHAHPADVGGGENPHTKANTTDDERADMLADYLELLADEFGETPRLIPLDDEAKAPIITGTCGLDTERGRSYLVDGDEAVRQIREDGRRGFAIYAGKPEHNTEDLVLVDVDDRETFPYEDFPATLMVLSGSARGEHFTYRDGGDVNNASGKDGVDGEVRAQNWYCVTPGSIHPSGGVYHIYKERSIETLHNEDVPTALRPASDRQDTDTEDYEPDPSADVKAVTRANTWIAEYLAGLLDNPDRSKKDFAACRKFASAGVSEEDARDVLANSSASKVGSADASSSYWSETWANAVHAEERDTDTTRPDGGATTAQSVTADAPSVEGDDAETFATTPAEPIVDKNDRVSIVQATDDGREVVTMPLGQLQCQACGTVVGSHVKRGESIEPPNSCPACGKQAAFEPVGVDGEADPDLPIRTYLDPPWYAPSAAEPERIDELWGDIREYIRDHWDAGEEHEHLYDGLTAYVITTWLRPDLEFLPHLMLMGRFTGGKTRLLNTLARVSYRAIVTASATPASMFRLIDNYDVTFFVSEYHGLDPDTRRDLDAIIRAAQKRGEKVTRADPAPQGQGGFDPSVFDPFTHVAVATQYEPADDIISRCVQVRTSPAGRDMPATHDEARGRDIRNRLLYARLRYLESDEFDSAETSAYGYLAQRDIDGRPREKLLALLTVANLWDRTEEIEPFVDELVRATAEAEADSADARFVEAVRDLAFEEIGQTSHDDDTDPFDAVEIPLADVAERYNDMTGEDRSASWVGHVRARLGIDKDRKRDGTVLKDTRFREKLEQLCDDYGLAWESLDVHDPVAKLPEDKQLRTTCSLCGEMRWLAHKHIVEGYYLCDECAEETREAER